MKFFRALIPIKSLGTSTPPQISLIDKLFPPSGALTWGHRIGQCAAIGIVGTLCKIFMVRQKIEIHNKERFTELVYNRPKGTGLLSVCNHGANIDDLMLWTHIMPLKDLWYPIRMRWTATAADICFTNPVFSYFFACGRTVPMWRNVRDPDTGELVKRGRGVYQPQMQFLLAQLNMGEWVNFFPQGRVIQGAEKKNEEQIRFKWGVGRLLADADKLPIILPIWQCGLETINPMKRPYFLWMIPALITGRRVTVCFGEPIDLSGLLHKLQVDSIPPRERHRIITAKIQEKLFKLKYYTEELHRNSISKS